MKKYFADLRTFNGLRATLGIIALLGLFFARDGFAQSTNSLSAEIFIPQGGETFKAPAKIEIVAWVGKDRAVREGDSVSVEFFANTNSLGKRVSYWHPEKRPPSGPGMATPFIIVAAGFDSVSLTWNNVPAGSYALTAKATFSKSISSVSKAVNITVAP